MKFIESSLKTNIEDIESTAQYCIDPKYTLWVAKTTPWRGRRVVKLMQQYFKPDDKILDVGCSQGLTLGYTAQVFKHLQGIDVDAEALKTAKKRFKRYKISPKLSVYDGKKLPFKNNYFDGLISSEVFEHVDNQREFIKELHRVIKPHGKLIISTPNHYYPMECEFHLPFLSYLPKNLADLYVKLSGKGTSYDHINHPTYNRFTSIVGKYFKVDNITFNIVMNAKKFSLDKERGASAIIFSKLLTYLEKYQGSYLYRLIYLMLNNITPGWILVGTKK